MLPSSTLFPCASLSVFSPLPKAAAQNHPVFLSFPLSHPPSSRNDTGRWLGGGGRGHITNIPSVISCSWSPWQRLLPASWDGGWRERERQSEVVGQELVCMQGCATVHMCTMKRLQFTDSSLDALDLLKAKQGPLMRAARVLGTVPLWRVLSPVIYFHNSDTKRFFIYILI